MKTFKRFTCYIIGFVIFIAVIICGAIFLEGYKDYKKAINDSNIETLVNNVQSKSDYTKIGNISEDFLIAIVAIEDKRFLSHDGIDYISLVRATVRNLKAMEIIEGGSTITQQLAKNLYFDAQQTLTRKISELLLAKDLEKKYEKEEILELYVNVIYYGNDSYGIRQASKAYFKKNPSELSHDEATLLAGVPQSPSNYDLTKNLDRAKERQVYVEKAFKELESKKAYTN